MSDKRTVRIIGAMALVFAVVAVVMFFSGFFSEKETPKGNIPTSNQIQFGMKFASECDVNRDRLESNVMSDPAFVGYSMKDEYTMLYLSDNAEQTEELKSFLGIEGSFPEVDYESRDVIIAVGRRIQDISDRDKKQTADGQRVVKVVWDYDYKSDKAYIYTVRETDFLSGTDLEMYYFKKVDENCNMVEGIREGTVIVSEGKYHILYHKAENLYEYVFFDSENGTPVARGLSEKCPTITELSDKLIEIVVGGETAFFSPTRKTISSSIPYKARYVTNELISYTRVYDSIIILIIRNAFDPSQYGYRFDLPFTRDLENADSVFESIKYVDSTHVEVAYYSGSDRVLQKQTLVVPFMGQ